jgi:hypothetical protein
VRDPRNVLALKAAHLEIECGRHPHFGPITVLSDPGISHLRCHAAEACRSSEQDGVIALQLQRIGDRCRLMLEFGFT